MTLDSTECYAVFLDSILTLDGVCVQRKLEMQGEPLQLDPTEFVLRGWEYLVGPAYGTWFPFRNERLGDMNIHPVSCTVMTSALSDHAILNVQLDCEEFCVPKPPKPKPKKEAGGKKGKKAKKAKKGGDAADEQQTGGLSKSSAVQRS